MLQKIFTKYKLAGKDIKNTNHHNNSTNFYLYSDIIQILLVGVDLQAIIYTLNIIYFVILYVINSERVEDNKFTVLFFGSVEYVQNRF